MWNTLGYFYTLVKNYEAARKAYGRGVKADPGNPMLAENLAGVSRRLGLKSDPDLAWLDAYSRLEKIAGAPGDAAPREVKEADALLALEPANPKARLLRAKIYFKAGRLSKPGDRSKEACLKKLPCRQPGPLRPGYDLRERGNIQLARAEWQRFCQLDR